MAVADLALEGAIDLTVFGGFRAFHHLHSKMI
jgi:hypothetical protein